MFAVNVQSVSAQHMILSALCPVVSISLKSGIKIRRNSHPSFGLRSSLISDPSFPLHVGLFPPFREKVLLRV